MSLAKRTICLAWCVVIGKIVLFYVLFCCILYMDGRMNLRVNYLIKTIMLLVAVICLMGCGEREVQQSSQTVEPAQEQSDVPESTDASDTSSGESSSAPELQTVRITIPEGYTLARVGMMLEEQGFCTVDEFIDITQNGDFSAYSLVAQQQPDENRCFRLEGYLFPDTYEVYTTDTLQTIIGKILEHTEQKIDASLREQIAASGYTVDEILTMASIIEKEAFGHGAMAEISSVLHNRLDIGMMLQCDVSIVYVEGAIKPFITGDIDRYNEHYNTYKCPALPSGAICNPGMDAIKAALNPADTDYLYFVTDSDKNYLFSGTYEGHEQDKVDAGLTTGQTNK